jgi:hypothetical protein
MKVSDMKCRLCERSLPELQPGLYLRRVNEKGVPGIWECAPACDKPLASQDDALLGAIRGES